MRVGEVREGEVNAKRLTCRSFGANSTLSALDFSSKPSIGSRGTASIFASTEPPLPLLGSTLYRGFFLVLFGSS